MIHRLKNKMQGPYSPQIKEFARSLHFHSPAAYRMVRESFANCLSSIETLNRWYSLNDHPPGMSENAIKNVSEMVSQESRKTGGKKLVFNITSDGIGIKKWAQMNKKSEKWMGLIDLGGQLEPDRDKVGNIKLATKVLVFMLVNINGGSKIPVAYYFTNSLSGTNKSILLKDLLLKLHEANIEVVSVTFDGDESNVKACSYLGANFDYDNKSKFKPYLDYPVTSEPV
ncbi:hypothetical protein QAD02_003051 [Eretmocerus hayati]|uniref:Uncharacterized protein n=1 Tax=Eretmocerus hayati TaxID=131215 RepID=A0ACC2NL12_9HYME|nr:hypothetical protein QAD02_003051 [Eretmocerus hayati]